MLRAQGFNVPYTEDTQYGVDSEWDWLADNEIEPPIMDMRYGPDCEVDIFMALPYLARANYADGMGFDFDA